MSFDIHGFAPTTSTDPTAGLLILRFEKTADADTVAKVTRELADAGVLESDRAPTLGGNLAALPWRVPGPEEADTQRDALSRLAGISEAWAIAQSAEADLSDWFAPTWRTAPPTAPAGVFGDAERPERVSWEGFGISMTFGRVLEAGDRDIVRALAELWLTAYSDHGTDGPLGGRCYARAVIADHGPSGVIVGLEGLANPGTDESAIGHLLWLAEQVGRVLPLTGVDFMSVLPQAGESGETIAPAKVLERATREWSGELIDELAEISEELAEIDFEPAPETLSEEVAAAATDEVETITGDAISNEFDDESWAVETQHLPRADEVLADALAKRSNGVSTTIAVEPSQTSPNDAVTVDAAELDLSETVDSEYATSTESASELLTDDGAETAVSDDAAIIEALEAGDLPAALAAFDNCGDKRGAAEILTNVIESLDASDWDDLQPILDLGERIIPTDPESSSAHLQMINALCRLGRGDEAIELGLKHIERDDVLYETYERLCVFRRTDETAALLPRLAEQGHEGVGNHYYNLGCKLHASQPEIAMALYRGAIACGSPRPQADINAGIALMSMGKLGEAEAMSKAAIENCGDEPNLWANLIDVQTRLRSAELDDTIERATAVLGNFDDDEVDSAAASGAGWAALLSDIIEALLVRDRAGDAIALAESHIGDDAPQIRVGAGLARAKAIVGDIEGARAILDHVDTSDATSFVYYRARANTMYLAGNRDAALGLVCAAMLADDDALELMKADPVAKITGDLAMAEDGTPPRPPTVPNDAVWVADDREWELGARDENGDKHGPFRYFRADGTLCNECVMVAGKPHGDFLRFHESGEVSQQGAFEEGELHGTRIWTASDTTTSEIMHNEHISTVIRRSEMDYVRGRVVAVRHYNGDGVLCAPNGEPYPDRPGDVAADAFFRAEDEEWVAGEVDEDGQRRGVWKRWSSEGVLLEESEYLAGDRHGAFRAYFPDGSLSAEGQYSEGEKTGTFVYQRRGDDEHEDFPVAAPAIGVAEETHETSIPGIRLYDKSGREVTIDGTPLEEWTQVHPELESWFNELWQVPWPELDDASSNAHRVPHLLLGLLATDSDLNQYVYRAIYWHLYHEGHVFSGTAAAMPFLVRLAQSPHVPFLSRLCDFIRHAGTYPVEALEEAAETGNHAVISTNDALMKRIDAFVELLGHPDEDARAAAGAVLSGAARQAEAMSSHLSGALATEESDKVRASHMFSLARCGTPEALFVVEAQLDSGSPYVSANAAMAMVMARGEQAGDRAADRIIAALVNFTEDMAEAYSDSPWSDDHIVTELAQALHYGCEGNTALTRLAASFGDIKTEAGTAAVAASLMIASASGGGLTEEVAEVLLAIANTESLWSLGDSVAELLDGYELPSTPDGLRELAE